MLVMSRGLPATDNGAATPSRTNLGSLYQGGPGKEPSKGAPRA